MRRYESVVILDPDLPDDGIRQFTDRYTALIKNNGGEIIKLEDWGKKKLAYLVKKRDAGRYLLLDYVGVPDVISEVERNFKIDEEVMKFLSVKLDENVDLDAFKAKVEQEAAKAKAEPASPEPPEKKEVTEAAEEAAEPLEAAKEAAETASDIEAVSSEKKSLDEPEGEKEEKTK